MRTQFKQWVSLWQHTPSWKVRPCAGRKTRIWRRVQTGRGLQTKSREVQVKEMTRRSLEQNGHQGHSQDYSPWKHHWREEPRRDGKTQHPICRWGSGGQRASWSNQGGRRSGPVRGSLVKPHGWWSTLELSEAGGRATGSSGQETKTPGRPEI